MSDLPPIVVPSAMLHRQERRASASLLGPISAGCWTRPAIQPHSPDPSPGVLPFRPYPSAPSWLGYGSPASAGIDRLKKLNAEAGTGCGVRGCCHRLGVSTSASLEGTAVYQSALHHAVSLMEGGVGGLVQATRAVGHDDRRSPKR